MPIYSAIVAVVAIAAVIAITKVCQALVQIGRAAAAHEAARDEWNS